MANGRLLDPNSPFPAPIALTSVQLVPAAMSESDLGEDCCFIPNGVGQQIALAASTD